MVRPYFFKIITDYIFMSADIMTSICGIYICMNKFSKTTRPRDMLFLLGDTLSIEDVDVVTSALFCLHVEPWQMFKYAVQLPFGSAIR